MAGLPDMGAGYETGAWQDWWSAMLELEAVVPLRRNVALGIKFATYNAKSSSVDTKKLWFWVEAKY